jgi:hypothetical protein
MIWSAAIPFLGSRWPLKRRLSAWSTRPGNGRHTPQNKLHGQRANVAKASALGVFSRVVVRHIIFGDLFDKFTHISIH